MGVRLELHAKNTELVRPVASKMWYIYEGAKITYRVCRLVKR